MYISRELPGKGEFTQGAMGLFGKRDGTAGKD